MIIINFNFLIKIIILLMYLLFFLTKTRDEKRKMTFYYYIDAKTNFLSFFLSKYMCVI